MSVSKRGQRGNLPAPALAAASEALAMLAPDLEDLAAQHAVVRAKALRVLGVLLAVGALVAVILFGFVIAQSFPFFFVIFGLVVTAIIGSGIWAFAVGPAHKEYRASFKERVIGRLVSRRYPDAAYSAEDGIAIEDFRASGLFRQAIDRYDHEDLIAGRLGKTDFEVSEVQALYKTESTDSEGNTTTHWHTIFQGLFFVGDFHKHFQGVTAVVPQSGSFGARSAIRGRLKRDHPAAKTFEDVRLEDPDFEDAFAVFGSDQVEARYLLSTSLMRRLLDFHELIDRRLWLSFVGDRMYLAIENDEDSFEPPSIWSRDATIDVHDLATYLAEIGLAEDIVEGLALNTRVWSKV